MASTGTAVAPLGIIPLKFSREFLDGNGDVAVQLDASNPALIKAIQDNKVPAPDQPIIIAKADINVQPGSSFTFGSGNAKVGFSAGAGARLGIFGLPGQLRDGIIDGGDLAESIEQALNFDNGSGQPFLLLRLAYDVNGTASGSMALGPAGQLTFSANAGRQGLYAIVRQPAATDGFVESLEALAGGARLPKQVKTVDDLAPASWIIAEADGTVGLRADVKFGYDFSWIRQTKLGTLSGDIGLKLASGISAGLGFEAAGKYAVLVSRESPNPAGKVLRLRVLKMRMNEFDLAFNAQATVTPVAGILPDQLDDLIKGALGTHGAQIVRLLGKVDDWTKPDQPIFGPLAGLAGDEARRIVSRITGIQDLNAGFNEAKGKIRKLFDAWHQLPADAASRLLALDKSGVTTAARDILKQIDGASEDNLKALLAKQLGDIPFLQSPAGQFIDKLAVEGLFAALNNDGLLADLQKAARLALGVLDGSDVQNTLNALQDEIGSRLKLSQIEDAVNSADLNKLDAWFRARLEKFLEQDLAGPDGLKALQTLRDNIRKIRDAMPDLYRKALAALHRNYTFSLNAAYKKTHTSQALVDLEFDFGAPNSEAAEMLRLALQGRFDDVLTGTKPGVTIREAALTYAIHKDTSVALALPFFNRTETHSNDALVTMSNPKESGGRLFFQLKAQDLVTVKNEFSASLTISMNLFRADRTGDVMVHSEDSATYLQMLDRAFARESTNELIQYASTFVEPLFRNDFGAGNFRTWVNETFGTGVQLGKALLALQVTLPPAACLAWVNAPKNRKSPIYQELSIRLQTRMKQLIHDAFFQQIERYHDVGSGSPAFAVMVYASIPPCTKAALAGGKLTITTSDPGGSIYWNHPDADLRRAMAGASRSAGNLPARMAAARARLQAAGDPAHVVPYYKDGQAGTIIAAARNNQDLISLLFVEAILVNKVVAAALEMARFRDTGMNDPAGARRALAKFGADITEAFDAKLKNIAVGDALMPLGSLMFIEAAQILDPALQGAASAMLCVIDVKDTIAFPPANFPDYDPLPAADIVRAETLIHAV